jgi:hypothetical protein
MISSECGDNDYPTHTNPRLPSCGMKPILEPFPVHRQVNRGAIEGPSRAVKPVARSRRPCARRHHEAKGTGPLVTGTAVLFPDEQQAHDGTPKSPCFGSPGITFGCDGL